MAKQNPHINYIGIEMYESVILSALERLIEEELPNLKLLNVDANHLSEFLQKMMWVAFISISLIHGQKETCQAPLNIQNVLKHV